MLTEQTETNDKKLNLSENEFVSGKLCNPPIHYSDLTLAQLHRHGHGARNPTFETQH